MSATRFVPILVLLVVSGIKSLLECDEEVKLLCFEGELRQILVNLVSNAFDAMRLGGTLRIRISQTSNSGVRKVRIVSADTGCGMSPQERSHLFEPFFSTKGIGGTGLGLWITRDLVSQNLGTIDIRSSARIGRSGTVARLRFYPG